MHSGPGLGWVLLILGGVALLLFVILIVLLVVLASRSSRGKPAARTAAPGWQTPLEILQARYARGEITREEYLEMREDLRQGAPPG